MKEQENKEIETFCLFVKRNIDKTNEELLICNLNMMAELLDKNQK